MSLTNRPRIVVDGVRRMRTFHYFWCLYCQRIVRVPSTNTQGSFCPNCFHRLRYELDIITPRLLMNLEPSPATHLMQNLALILDSSPRRPNNHFNTTLPQRETENEVGPNSHGWITLRFSGPTRPFRPISPPQNLVPHANAITPFENIFDNFNDGMIHNNRPGPPPATSSAIQSLPMLKLTHTHLASDPNCPICKDDFELDMEVRLLPCSHFYHSDCILPWLRMHNTCPVCRSELQGVATSNYSFQNDNEHRFGFEDVTSSFNWIWSQVSSFRPIRRVLDWTQSYFDFQENHVRSRRGKRCIASQLKNTDGIDTEDLKGSFWFAHKL